MADPRRTPAKSKKRTSARRIPVEEVKPSEEEMAPLEESEDMSPGHEEETEEVPSGPDPEKLQLRERLLRLQAEFDNYRKRQARDFRRLCSQGKKELILELLAVLDNYHRAEKLVEEGGHSVEEIADGLMKTSQQLEGILAQEGLSELGVSRRDPFDPNIHEAMLAEDTDDMDTDSVLEVYQKGYRLNDELLRPARVKVGRARKRPAVTDEEEEQRDPSGGGE